MIRPDLSWSSAPLNDIQKRVMPDMCKVNGYLATCRTPKDMVSEIKEAEAQALITGHEGAESVGAREAAAVDARARRRAEVEVQCKSTIDSVVAAKGYAVAARLPDEMGRGRAPSRPRATGAPQKPTRTSRLSARLWPCAAGPSAR